MDVMAHAAMCGGCRGGAAGGWGPGVWPLHRPRSAWPRFRRQGWDGASGEAGTRPRQDALMGRDTGSFTVALVGVVM